MEKMYRTKFGKFLTILGLDRRLNIAGVSRELGLSHSTLSMIISGQQPIPTFLRENIIVTFDLTEREIADLDQSIIETESEAVVVNRGYREYVETNVLNKSPWTKSLMGMMAAKVNNLTPEAAEEIQHILTTTEFANDMSAAIPKKVLINVLEKDLFRRYKKDPEKAQRILDYLKATRKNKEEQ